MLVPARAGSGAAFSELVNENLLTVNGNTWLACAPAPPQCGQLLMAAPPRCGRVGVLSAPLQADSTWVRPSNLNSISLGMVIQHPAAVSVLTSAAVGCSTVTLPVRRRSG